MLIRSQNKKSIVNMDNIVEISVVSREIYSFCGKNHTQIGTYSTEEKAIKVLDMIQNAYSVMKRADCLNSGTLSQLAQFSEEEREMVVQEIANVYIFQMPSD